VASLHSGLALLQLLLLFRSEECVHFSADLGPKNCVFCHRIRDCRALRTDGRFVHRRAARPFGKGAMCFAKRRANALELRAMRRHDRADLLALRVRQLHTA
jgi:hypothetical protein